MRLKNASLEKKTTFSDWFSHLQMRLKNASLEKKTTFSDWFSHLQTQKKTLKCNCIRCNEIGDLEFDGHSPYLAVRQYEASEGLEYYISIEAHAMNTIQKLVYYLILFMNALICLYGRGHHYWAGDLQSYIGLFGFLRLRFDPAPGGNKDETFIPEIQDCALIREVHVYGTSMGVGTDGEGSQHKGYGKWLMILFI